MKSNKIMFLGVALLVVAGLNANATEYFVKEATAVGVSADEASAVTEIVRNSVGENGDNQVTVDSLKAIYVLRPKLIKLGSAYLMTLEKYKNNKVVYSSQLKADRVEELDNIAARLTRAVILERQAKEDTHVSEINDNDKLTGTKRRDAVKRWEIALGAASLANVNDTNTEFNFLIGYEWEIPTSNASIKLFYDGMVYFGNFGIAGSYFFKDSDSSPVVTADLGYGTGSVKTDNLLTTVGSTVSGFIAGAGVGYRFFRSSTINIETTLHYDYLFNKNYLGNPTALSFKVGLYF